jgi:tetratricopeptide (TPR) repeat protein
MDNRVDLLRLERSNMVTKIEDRIKVGLVAMSERIMGHLRSCSPGAQTPEMLNRLAVQFNQGALVHYQAGEIERAEALCRGEIELFADLSRRSPYRAICLAYMVPPYINLARIYGQKGEVKNSLAIFEDVYRFGRQRQDLWVCGHHIPVTDLAALLEAGPYYEQLMLSCWVIDASRVLLTVEDFPALLELVDVNIALPEYQVAPFKQYLLEVRSRALLGLRQYDSALEAAAECCREMPVNFVDRVMINALLSQIYREAGRYKEAREIMNRVEGILTLLEQSGRRVPVARQIAYRLALERHALGDNSIALAHIVKATEKDYDLVAKQLRGIPQSD